VNLSEPILSRFDILCVVRDTPDPIADEKLAQFVVNSHVRHHPYHKPTEQEMANQEEDPHRRIRFGDVIEHDTSDEEEGLQEGEEVEIDPRANSDEVRKISQELLRKYVIYAREKCHPVLDRRVDEDRIAHMYTELRRESMVYVFFITYCWGQM